MNEITDPFVPGPLSSFGPHVILSPDLSGRRISAVPTFGDVRDLRRFFASLRMTANGEGYSLGRAIRLAIPAIEALGRLPLQRVVWSGPSLAVNQAQSAAIALLRILPQADEGVLPYHPQQRA
jgi:hypothetical protein